MTTLEEKARSNTGMGRWIRVGLGLAITVACVGFIAAVLSIKEGLVNEAHT